MKNTDLFIDVIGWLGAASYIIPYFLLIRKKMRSTSVAYHVFNILGGIFLIINTVYYGALPSAFTNGIWGSIALYGMWSDRKSSQIGLAPEK